MSPTPMTPQEQIEYLATKVMGWRRRNYTWKVIENDRSIQPCASCGSKEHTGHSSVWEHVVCPHCDSWEDNEERGFDPLENWNHWRQVEEKMFKDDRFYFKWLDRLPMNSYNRFKADLPTRVSALISAHQQLSQASDV